MRDKNKIGLTVLLTIAVAIVLTSAVSYLISQTSFVATQQATLANSEPTATDEPPFYNVDRRGTGPLTMEELQINFPSELRAQLSTAQQDCILTKVEELIAAAGDPATLNPADVNFLPTDRTWDDLTQFGRRSILAQAVISHAAVLCT